jgi:hypothetical protein
MKASCPAVKLTFRVAMTDHASTPLRTIGMAKFADLCSCARSRHDFPIPPSPGLTRRSIHVKNVSQAKRWLAPAVKPAHA